jgi:PTH1 family peptidyl-tRNA hydrolase
MSQADRLIVGLGNPEARYEGTRHNIGFAVLDALASRTGVALTSQKGQALLGWGRWQGRGFGLMKPLTYMNRSGLAVEAVVRRYQLPRQALLVIADDLHLPTGAIRLRPSGGAGGHNGLQDIIDWLDADDFPRMRLGVGNQFARGRQAEYVLSPFSPAERPVMDEAVAFAVEAALTFVTEGITAAMNRFNRKG